MIVLVDLAVLLSVLALLVGVPVYFWYQRKQSELSAPENLVLRQAEGHRTKGETNVVRLEAARERLCIYCDRLTDPDYDLFLKNRVEGRPDAWAHHTCYQVEDKSVFSVKDKE